MAALASEETQNTPVSCQWFEQKIFFAIMRDLILDIAGKSKVAEYVLDSKVALRFQLVRNEDEIIDVGAEDTEGRMFSPAMTHQIYGEHEFIFGYRDLKIDFLMSAATLRVNIQNKFTEEFSKPELPNLKPDKVLPPLQKLLAEGQLIENRDEFRKVVREEDAKFRPMGEKIHGWEVEGREFEIYFCGGKESGFQAYHQKLQPWIMFYIDAASYIDTDDENWKYFLMFEKYSESGNPRYAIAGYVTVYQYYAYPEHQRQRISQMLVLPPFQRKGLGSRLLDTVQRYFWQNKNVIDITVEDPSDEFIRLRDFVDCRNCMKLETFNPDNLKKGFSPEMAEEAKKTFKIGKKQARQVYEILRLKCTKKEDPEEFKAYRVDVKRRLNLPYLKEDRQLKRLKKVLKPEEYTAATITFTTKVQRIEHLQVQYQQLEDHFVQIIERLATA